MKSQKEISLFNQLCSQTEFSGANRYNAINTLLKRDKLETSLQNYSFFLGILNMLDKVFFLLNIWYDLQILEIIRVILKLYDQWKNFDDRKEIAGMLNKMPKPKPPPNRYVVQMFRILFSASRATVRFAC